MTIDGQGWSELGDSVEMPVLDLVLATRRAIEADGEGQDDERGSFVDNIRDKDNKW